MRSAYASRLSASWGQVADEKRDIWLRRRFVERRRRALERLDAERILRPMEANVKIIELRESEVGGRFAVGFFELTVQFRRLRPGARGTARIHRVRRSQSRSPRF